MADPIVERIRQHPQYPRLKTERSRLGWTLTILMLIVFYGFIGLIAFDRQFLAQPLSADGVTTIGIPIALGVIFYTVLITGFYVHLANSRYDAMTRDILKETTQ